MSASTPTLTLYDHPVSSYAQKLRIALREKKLPFTAIVPSDFSTLSAANPRAEVPVLIHKDPTASPADDISLFDSTIMLEYLEERFPVPALMPASPAGRAKQRAIEEIVDPHYEAVNWGVSEIRAFDRAEGELARTLERNAAQHIATIQAWLTTQLGDAPYFAGDAFGWGDVCVAPILNRSVSAGMGPQQGSKLQQWHARIQERASVRKTFEEFDGGIGKMPLLKDAFLSGVRKREYRDHRLEWMIKSGGLEVVRKGIEVSNVRFSWPDNPP